MLFSDRVGAPTSPLFIIIPHFPAFVNICNRISRNFFSVYSIFSPPAQGGARKRTDARTKAAHGRAKGRGGPGRENGAVGGTRAGRARRTSRRQNRASHQQTGWGAGGGSPGEGGGGSKPPQNQGAQTRMLQMFL